MQACYSLTMTTTRSASNGVAAPEARDRHPRRAGGGLGTRRTPARHLDAPAVGPRRRAGRDRAGGPADRAAQLARARSSSRKGGIRSAIILAQEADRLQDLLPLRHGRMAASAFAFYRGAPGRDGARPVDHAAERHHRPGQRRRAHLELRSVRLARANARLRLERLRRDPARAVGVGRQAPRRERRHRRARERFHGGRGARVRRSPPCAPTASRWHAYSGMRLLDIWYDQTTAEDIDAARRGGKGDRPQRAQPQGRLGRASTRCSPRPAARTG